MKAVATLLATVFVGTVGVAAVEELLFHYDFTGREDFVAEGGYSFDPFPYKWTYDTVTEVEWNAMTTDDFKKYKAIIIGDPISTDPEDLDIIMGNRKTWGAAISGNVILIGTDTSNHYSNAQELITNGIAFAATGKGTGLYFSLSKYYGDRNQTAVPILDIFGEFEVRGDLNSEQLDNCYDDVHIVAESPVLTNITDKVLSNWTCSVHEAFVTYPSTGEQSFVPLAIAENVPGSGSREFSDGTRGIPYILVRGASPIGCGNGRLDPGEECDDGNTRDGDGCNSACRFESGAQGKKSAAGPVVGGVLGGVIGAAALAGLGFLAVTKTMWGAKAAAAVGISSAGGAGGGGASGAAGATGAMYVPTGLESKAAAAAAGYVPTGLEAKAAASATGYVPGVTEKAAASIAQSAGQAAHGAAQATSGLSAIPPPMDGGATAASSAFAPPIADPTGGAALASAAAGAGTGAGTSAGAGASTAMVGASSAGAMGPAAGVGSVGAMAPTAGAGAVSGTTAAFAPTAATGGGLAAGPTAGTSIAAGFVGTITALFGRRKKNKDETAGMPVPPMAPTDPSLQYYPQQPYPQQPQQAYYPQGQQPMFAPPIPAPMSGFDEKEIKSAEAYPNGGLSVGVQEVVPTPSPTVHPDPLSGDEIMLVSEQPYIPPPGPPQATWIHDKAIDAGEIPPPVAPIRTSVQESVYAPNPPSIPEGSVEPVSPVTEMPVMEQPFIPPPPPSAPSAQPPTGH
ncbi:hypothetical protein TWF696_007973 [Orbilia brochopaga]|uniref:DUF4215 domain-containing protein n=1 Tax=Orbilia brochopaga TaxID=3140254 RepID=A0AAV9UMV2_9PEZI